MPGLKTKFISILRLKLVLSVFVLPSPLFAALGHPSQEEVPHQALVKTKYNKVEFSIDESLVDLLDLEKSSAKLSFLLSQLSEQYFKKDFLKDRSIQIVVTAGEGSEVDGTQVHTRGRDFLFTLTLGRELSAEKLQAIFDSVLIHEAAHIIYEGLAGSQDRFSLPSIFNEHLADLSTGLDAKKPSAESLKKLASFRRIFETYNELFADVVSYYINGLDDLALVETKGEFHGFQKALKVNDRMLESNYYYLAPSRHAIHQNAIAQAGNTERLHQDLFSYFELFISETKKFSDLTTVDMIALQAMNKSLKDELKKIKPRKTRGLPKCKKGLS